MLLPTTDIWKIYTFINLGKTSDKKSQRKSGGTYMENLDKEKEWNRRIISNVLCSETPIVTPREGKKSHFEWKLHDPRDLWFSRLPSSTGYKTCTLPVAGLMRNDELSSGSPILYTHRNLLGPLKVIGNCCTPFASMDVGEGEATWDR